MNDGFPIQRATPSFFSDPRPRRGRRDSAPRGPSDPATLPTLSLQARAGHFGLRRPCGQHRPSRAPDCADKQQRRQASTDQRLAEEVQQGVRPGPQPPGASPDPSAWGLDHGATTDRTGGGGVLDAGGELMGVRMSGGPAPRHAAGDEPAAGDGGQAAKTPRHAQNPANLGALSVAVTRGSLSAHPGRPLRLAPQAPSAVRSSPCWVIPRHLASRTNGPDLPPQSWQGCGGLADPRPATRDPGRNQRPATRDPERPGPPGPSRTYPVLPGHTRPGPDICQDQDFKIIF